MAMQFSEVDGLIPEAATAIAINGWSKTVIGRSALCANSLLETWSMDYGRE